MLTDDILFYSPVCKPMSSYLETTSNPKFLRDSISSPSHQITSPQLATQVVVHSPKDLQDVLSISNRFGFVSATASQHPQACWDPVLRQSTHDLSLLSPLPRWNPFTVKHKALWPHDTHVYKRSASQIWYSSPPFTHASTQIRTLQKNWTP